MATEPDSNLPVLNHHTARCPVGGCGATITVDSTMAVRECGHWVLRLASGVLVSSRDWPRSLGKLAQFADRTPNTGEQH